MTLGHKLKHDIDSEMEVLRVYLFNKDIHKGGEYANNLIRDCGEDPLVIDKVREIYDQSGMPFYGYIRKTG